MVGLSFLATLNNFSQLPICKSDLESKSAMLPTDYSLLSLLNFYPAAFSILWEKGFAEVNYRETVPKKPPVSVLFPQTYCLMYTMGCGEIWLL